MTLFLVERDKSNLEIRPIPKLGYRALHSCEVFYENVEVSASDIIGEVGQGMYHLLDTLNVERLGAAALALGVGQAAFDSTLKYAKERTAFGRPIGQFQQIQRYISDMALNLEQARL